MRIILPAAAALLSASPALAQDAEGEWQGILSTGAADLRLHVTIADTDGDGALDGKVVSIDQGNAEIPIGEVEHGEANLIFTVPAIGGKYEGQWEDGSWVGTWSQGPASLPLTLSPLAADEEVSAPTTPADYQLPDDEAVTAILTRMVDGRDNIIASAILIDDGDARILSSSDLPGGARYEIGSITKVFTSLLLADMVLDGTISLNDRIIDHLPEGSFAKAEQGSNITFADLASHRSGLTRMPWNFFLYMDGNDPFANFDEAALIQYLEGVEMDRAPGDQAEYSNIATGLLGWMLGRLDGSDYDSALQRRILDPMGLAATSTGHDENSLTAHADASPGSAWTFKALKGAGALRQTPEDFARFAAILADPSDRWKPHLELMRSISQPAPGGGGHVGLGIFTIPTGGRDLLFHNGATGGFRSALWIDPSTKRAVGILLNSTTPSPDPVGRHLISGLGSP